ncbi:hypothetical protein BOX37_18000 [Nocardia mangyaensis]|uniref:catalase n=2 Tax=Nocardia mangyaensis TaxID=2213200 RepID=A0A1J0VU37_9NOCA|nr:hypothetical protein BOX37_18000 [Nocardia mangyaensis]
MFYRGLTPGEQQHLADTFAFELGKCSTPMIRRRGLQMILNVDEQLADYVAGQLGLPVPTPNADRVEPPPSPASSPRRGTFPLDGRTVAVLVDDTTSATELEQARAALEQERVRPLLVAARGGEIAGVPVDRTFATMRSVEFDGALLLAGSVDPQVDLLIAELWRHGKAIAGVDVAGQAEGVCRHCSRPGHRVSHRRDRAGDLHRDLRLRLAPLRRTGGVRDRR